MVSRRLGTFGSGLILTALLMGFSSASGQGTREISVGLSAGAGAVQVGPGRKDDWTFGPFFGSRLRWGNLRSAFSLSVDVQPFRATSPVRFESYRALYVLPGYETGSPGRKIRFGLGMGAFQFGEGAAKTTETAWVAGAAGTVGLSRSLFVELAWRGARNIRDLSANVYALQLMKVWR